MSFYDYWIDSDGNPHKISDMSSDYIANVLNQMDKWDNAWRCVTEDKISAEEIRDLTKVGTRAWYFVNGKKLREALELELEFREAMGQL